MESIKELRAKCQGVHAGDITVKLTRMVSVYITWLLIPTGITGNGVSLLNVFVGIGAGAVMVTGSLWGYVGGVLLLLLNIVLDCVDGEMARYRRQSSLTGLFSDRVNSIFVFPAVLLGTGVGLFREYDEIWILFVAFAAAWGFNALRMVKTSIDTTLVDALTLEKARQEDTSRAKTDSSYTPFSEHLRSKKRLHLSVIDLLLVRGSGFLLASLLGIGGHVVAVAVTDTLPWYASPAVYFVLVYAVLLTLAIPAAIAVVVRTGRIETSYNHLVARRDAVADAASSDATEE